MTKFIVVTGGVISSVGKGITTASLGIILKEHGFKTTLIKIDPYINYDAGTMRPTEHGEVWVTEDGGEIDQDLGTYERFMNESMPKKNNITTGQIYKSVIDKERAGEYLGRTVQFAPHILDEIKLRVKHAAQGYEIAIVEVGGTVGDYENTPYLMALKSLERDFGRDSFVHILVTYLPIPDHLGEMKTKPTLQAIRLLGQEGILPDFIICRAKYALDEERRKKIVDVANIAPDCVISEPDIDTTVYQIPLDLEKEHLGEKILNKLDLQSRKTPDWSSWQTLVDGIVKPEKKVTVAIVGKYLESGSFSVTDSYISIQQALIHAGAQLKCAVDIKWLDAKQFEHDERLLDQLQNIDGLIIPGGFGTSGVEGKIKAIEYVRTHNIPYLGLCYGMQLAAIEYARHVCSLVGAHTTEVDAQTPHAIVDILPLQKANLENHAMGGTMRLGGFEATIKQESTVSKLYKGAYKISERHRHRYEMNPTYVQLLEEKGLCFSGHYVRDDGTKLMEYLELPKHKFFVATQAHPEFNSRFGYSNPLFHGFVKACFQAAE